jgi:hypothetical protein
LFIFVLLFYFAQLNSIQLHTAVLSGKELFNFNASLFVDDDAAIDATEENALSARAKEEAAKAQAEQMRLAEAQRLEEEARLFREEQRRIAARDPDRVTFMLGNVIINQVVFDVDEKENLEPFVDVIETTVEAEEREAMEIDNDNDNDNENADGEMGVDDEEEEEEDDEDEDDDDEDEDDDDDDDEEEEEDGDGDGIPKIAMSANLMKALGMDTSGVDTATDWKPPERPGIDANPDSLKISR